jgi:hypothetical protein
MPAGGPFPKRVPYQRYSVTILTTAATKTASQLMGIPIVGFIELYKYVILLHYTYELSFVKRIK